MESFVPATNFYHTITVVLQWICLKNLVIIIPEYFQKGREKIADRYTIPVNRCGNNFKAVLQIMFKENIKGALNAVKAYCRAAFLSAFYF